MKNLSSFIAILLFLILFSLGAFAFGSMSFMTWCSIGEDHFVPALLLTLIIGGAGIGMMHMTAKEIIEITKEIKDGVH